LVSGITCQRLRREEKDRIMPNESSEYPLSFTMRMKYVSKVVASYVHSWYPAYRPFYIPTPSGFYWRTLPIVDYSLNYRQTRRLLVAPENMYLLDPVILQGSCEQISGRMIENACDYGAAITRVRTTGMFIAAGTWLGPEDW
jgi:hypothetical protein